MTRTVSTRQCSTGAPRLDFSRQKHHHVVLKAYKKLLHTLKGKVHFTGLRLTINSASNICKLCYCYYDHLEAETLIRTKNFLQRYFRLFLSFSVGKRNRNHKIHNLLFILHYSKQYLWYVFPLVTSHLNTFSPETKTQSIHYLPRLKCLINYRTRFLILICIDSLVNFRHSSFNYASHEYLKTYSVKHIIFMSTFIQFNQSSLPQIVLILVESSKQSDKKMGSEFTKAIFIYSFYQKENLIRWYGGLLDVIINNTIMEIASKLINCYLTSRQFNDNPKKLASSKSKALKIVCK